MDTASLFHIAFYKFTHVADVPAAAQRLREITEGLTGSILIASEGINGMMAGSTAQMDGFEAALQTDAGFGGAFARRAGAQRSLTCSPNVVIAIRAVSRQSRLCV